MESFECSICLEKFKDPIECLACHNNFCRKHVEGFKNICPICKKSPFNFRENIWLSRTLANIDYSFKCSLCLYEGDKNSFWSHLIESHKNEIIQHFNTNKNSNNSNSRNKNENIEKTKFKLFEDNNRNYQPKINQAPEINNSINNNSKGDNKIDNYNVQNIYPDYNKFNKTTKTSINNNSNNYNNNIPPPYTHRQNYPINNQNISQMNNFTNPQPTDRNNIIYCGNINNSIRCNCCPDHICKRGNCLCVRCMKNNINNLKLKNGELINRSGRIARLFKGSYYCECKYEETITNVIGLKFKKQSQCHYPLESCKDCKVLNRFKNIYLGKK